jgi:hypothetical protein
VLRVLETGREDPLRRDGGMRETLGVENKSG